MTRGLSTLLLLVVAIGLGAYIYFVEMRREPSDTEPPADRVFATLDAGTITALTLRATNGDETTVEREGTGWRMTAPVETKADATEVAGVTSNLTSLDVSRIIDEAPADLAAFELDAPRIVVGFTTDTGTERLMLGGRTATGGDIYAKLESSPRVFLIPSWLETSLDRTTFQLRDKAIATFDRTRVDRLSIIGTPGTIELVKQDDAWMLRQPISARADAGAVDTLLSRLSSGQMQAVVADAPATLDVYGLEPPRTTVAAAAGSDVLAQVLVGSNSGDTAVHMKDDARPIVFTVDTSLAADLERAVSAYRNRSLVTTDASAAKTISVVRATGTRSFERTAGDGEGSGTWTDASADAPLTSDRIAEFVSRLQTLRAESWEARAPSGATEVATITVIPAQGASEVIRVVRAGDVIFAVRSDEPGAARLAVSTVDDLLRLLDGADD